MAVPNPGHFCRWHLEPEDLVVADLLNSTQLKKLQTMNVELAEALAEFQHDVSAETGVFLNTPEYWMLRGRRGLVLELLQSYDDAKGQVEGSTSTGDNQSFSQPQTS